MSQLPPGTLGDAIGVLIYTFVCLIANALLIWLHWVTHQKLSCKANLLTYIPCLFQPMTAREGKERERSTG